MRAFRSILQATLALSLMVAIGALLLPAPASAQGVCGVPIQVAGAQGILPLVTVAPGQDLQVNLINRRNQDVEVAVAYTIPGTDEPIGRTEVTLSPGDRGAVPMSDSCLLVDTDTGRTAIWGSGGVALGVIPAD